MNEGRHKKNEETANSHVYIILNFKRNLAVSVFLLISRSLESIITWELDSNVRWRKYREQKIAVFYKKISKFLVLAGFRSFFASLFCFHCM